MHSSCKLNSKLKTDNDWDNTIMVVVDEISFIQKPDFEKLDKVLNAKCDAPGSSIFGNLQMVFAGDFCQLKPPSKFCKSLYSHTDFGLWYTGVNTLLELKTNHRFKNDVQWANF